MRRPSGQHRAAIGAAPRPARPLRLPRGSLASALLASALLGSGALPQPSAAEALPETAPIFRSQEGGFAAAFPEAPSYEEQRRTTILGPLRSRSWVVERGTGLHLRVERHDLPALATLVLTDDSLLERAAQGVLEDARARDAKIAPSGLREHPGRHLRYEPGDVPGEVEEAWLYLLGRRLYVVFARGGAAALRFAASVELGDD